MTMVESKYSKENTELIIAVKGNFGFDLMTDFRNSYYHEDFKQTEINVVVDLKETENIDSSALGMLLNMQRQLDKNDQDICIINCNDRVKKVFKITHFDKKFLIK